MNNNRLINSTIYLPKFTWRLTEVTTRFGDEIAIFTQINLVNGEIKYNCAMRLSKWTKFPKYWDKGVNS